VFQRARSRKRRICGHGDRVGYGKSAHFKLGSEHERDCQTESYRDDGRTYQIAKISKETWGSGVVPQDPFCEIGQIHGEDINASLLLSSIRDLVYGWTICVNVAFLVLRVSGVAATIESWRRERSRRTGKVQYGEVVCGKGRVVSP
jgi:hypothetical protein